MTSKGQTVGGLDVMGGQESVYDDLLSPASTMWASSPQAAMMQDMLVGVEYVDDFVGFISGTGAWIVSTATTGTATAGTLAGGTVALAAGATTANQGVQIQRSGSHFIPAQGKHIWFECRLKVNVLQTQFLCGLFDVDTTLIATGALHATDGIGFQCLTSDGVLLPVSKASSTATTGTTTNTLVAATYVRLGFTMTWGSITNVASVQPYVNGVATGSPITTNVPTASLTPSFVCQAGTGAGSNPQVDLDFVNVIQLR